MTEIGRRDECSTGSKFTLGIKFPMRAECDLDVLNVRRLLVTTSFGDIRRDRYGSFAHLVSQTKPFSFRKRLRDGVDQVCKVHGPLPCDEIAKALDVRH